MKTYILLVLMAFGCSSAMANLRIEPNYVEVESAVMKCLKTIDHEDQVTYWIAGKEDADGNQTFNAVKPNKFTLVEDLGEVEMDEELSNGNTITYKSHDYDGICTFY